MRFMFTQIYLTEERIKQKKLTVLIRIVDNKNCLKVILQIGVVSGIQLNKLLKIQGHVTG